MALFNEKVATVTYVHIPHLKRLQLQSLDQVDVIPDEPNQQKFSDKFNLHSRHIFGQVSAECF